MTTKLEQIDQLRKRANVGYEEAKEALEKCNDDMVEALVYLEKQNKTKAEKCCGKEHSFFSKVKKLIKKSWKTKFILKKNENIILAIPFLLVIIAAIVVTPLVAIGLIAALLTNHKIRLEKANGEDMAINTTLDKMSTAFTKAATNINETIHKSE